MRYSGKYFHPNSERARKSRYGLPFSLRLKPFVVFGALVASCTLFACSSDPDSVITGDIGADEVDVGEGDGSEAGDDAEVLKDVESVDVIESPPDTNGDGNDSPGNGPTQEMTWHECDCAHPDDKCPLSQCSRPDIDCGPGGEECPDGYHCVSGPGVVNHCRCDGPVEECGPFCDDQHDCTPLHLTCDVEDGVCRSGQKCIHSMNCPEGYTCDEREFGSSPHRYCYPKGDAELGEPCTKGSDCATGICHCVDRMENPECDDLVCTDQCLADRDCDEGEACFDWLELEYSWTANGCILLEGTQNECSVSCPDHMRCVSEHCVPAFCHTTADCDGADCVYRGLAMPPLCEEAPDSDEGYVCKPEEFRSQNGEFCILSQQCWEDSDCDEPYECGSDSFSVGCRRPVEDGAPP